MTLARTGTALGAVVAAAALLLATASIWLVLADPVAVADVATQGGQGFLDAVADLVFAAVKQVFRWL